MYVTILTDQEDIVKKTNIFYENLYKQEDQIFDVDLEAMNKEYEEEIPKLTDEQCKDMEGIITKRKRYYIHVKSD